jgi:hypothetical protein
MVTSVDMVFTLTSKKVLFMKVLLKIIYSMELVEKLGMREDLSIVENLLGDRKQVKVGLNSIIATMRENSSMEICMAMVNTSLVTPVESLKESLEIIVHMEVVL